MSSHRMARTTALGREDIARRKACGQAVARIARDVGVSDKTVRKWCARRGQETGRLDDRSSRPRRSPTALPAAWVDAVVALRRLRFTQLQIAQQLRLTRSTVARVCKRAGLSRLAALDPKAPVQRYVRERPGELVHIDIKRLVRIVRPSHRVTGDRRDTVDGAGFEYLHVAIDDATRVAYAEMMPGQCAVDAVAFLHRAAAWMRRYGIRIERVLTDNGYKRTFAEAVTAIGAVHKLTKPYRPKSEATSG